MKFLVSILLLTFAIVANANEYKLWVGSNPFSDSHKTAKELCSEAISDFKSRTTAACDKLEGKIVSWDITLQTQQTSCRAIGSGTCDTNL